MQATWSSTARCAESSVASRPRCPTNSNAHAGGDAGNLGKTDMATTQLNPSAISGLIKTRIEKVNARGQARNEGTVTSVAAHVDRIHGLADAMQGELGHPPKATYALALN